MLSCVNDYAFEENVEIRDVYVINGILTANTKAEIYLSGVSLIGETVEVENPGEFLVTLTWDEGQNTYVDTLTYKAGSFTGNYPLPESTSYSLLVVTPDGRNISAETEIPQPVSELNASMIFPAGFMEINNITGPFMRFFVDFEPSPGLDAYFESMIISVETPDQAEPLYHILNAVNNDQAILAENLPSNFLNSFVLKKGTDGSPHVSLAFDIMASGMISNPLLNEFLVSISAVSSDYYYYKKSLYNHLEATGFSEEFETKKFYFPDIFREVQPIHSNIKGGLGIFAGINSAYKRTACNQEGYGCN